VVRGLRELRHAGSVEPMMDRMQTRKELYGLLDYVPGEEWRFPSGQA
jgi:2-methylisocitrate lyase-like PEP mutase family enzyme